MKKIQLVIFFPPKKLRMMKTNNNEPQDNPRKADEIGSYMKMGTVTSIKKNGCVTKVTTEDGKEENYFVPGE